MKKEKFTVQKGGQLFFSGVLGFIVFLGVLSFALFAGYEMIFKTFRLYDDEGYVLFSLANFGSGGALYTDIYSQYGPAFFLIADGISQMFGFEWGSAVARWWTLVLWGGTAIGAGLLVRMTVRDWWAATASGIGVFIVLVISLSEPSHPGSFIAAVVMLAVLSVVGLMLAERWRSLAVAAGLFGAILGMTKINVGAFFVFAILFWMLAVLIGAENWKVKPRIVAFAGGILPFFALSGDLGDPSVFLLAAVSGVGVSGVILSVSSQKREDSLSGAEIIWFLCSGLLVSILVVGLSIVRGTSFPDLINGVVLGPLQHPGIYSFGIPVEKLFFLPTIGVFLWIILVLRNRKFPYYRAQIIGMRLIAAICLVIGFLPAPPLNPETWQVFITLPFVFSFAVPLGESASRSERVCGLVGMVLFFQILHAYPVAGSQVRWGNFLAVPMVVIGLTDTFDSFRKPILRFILSGALLLGAAQSIHRFSIAAFYEFDDWLPLSLPGAENLRLPADVALSYWLLNQNAVELADVLNSLPGTYSFNLWSGVSAPNGKNATHWFSLLSDEEQAEIEKIMEDSAQPLVIVNHGLIRFLLKKGIPIDSPLVDYITSEYKRGVVLPNHALWVRKDFEGQVIGVIEPELSDEGGLPGRFIVPDEPVTDLRVFVVFGPKYKEAPELLQRLSLERVIDGEFKPFWPPSGQGPLDIGPSGLTEVRVKGLDGVPAPVFFQFANVNGDTVAVLYKPPLEIKENSARELVLPAGDDDQADTKGEPDA